MILIGLAVIFIVMILPKTAPLGFLSPVTKFLILVFSLFISHTFASIISSKTGNREFQALGNILMTDCNVDLFFQESEPLFKQGSRQSNLAKYILLGNGYIANGDYSKSLDLLNKALSDADVDWITEEMQLNLCHIYRNACISLVEMKQYKEAITTYSSLNKLAGSIKKSEPFKEEANKIKLLTRDYIGIFTKSKMDTTLLENTFNSSPMKYEKLLLAHLLVRYFDKIDVADKKAYYADYISSSNANCFTSLSDL
jgi:tetratricopeptide (TPR) repeat protein